MGNKISCVCCLFQFHHEIMHSMLFVFLSCAAIIDWSDLDFSEEESDRLSLPNRHNRGVCNEVALQLSLGSRRYPEFLGIEGPQNHRIPWICT